MAYTRASYSAEIEAPADRVWALIGAFNRLPAILPKLVAKSALDATGLIRNLTIRDADGTRFKRQERLIKYDARTRTLIYQLIDKQRTRLAVKDYTATIKVTEISPRRCRVAWSGRFHIRRGSPAEVRALVEQVYADGIAGVKRKLGRAR